MSLSSLQALKAKRDALLLAEVAALLHDIGKLGSQFIDQMSCAPTTLPGQFEHENAVEKIPNFVDAAFLQVLNCKKGRNLLSWSNIKNNEQIGQLLDLIVHHDKANHSAFLVRLLNRCDGLDSGADKGTTRQDGLPKEAKQKYGNTFIATAFGNESKLDEANLDTARLNLSKYVSTALLPPRRADLLCQIHGQYSRGLAETRRSANDVTLWDHSFSVGTLYKTSLATFLLKGVLDLAQLRWRILRVNFDVLSLYAKALKIADLLAYQEKVEDACAAVKSLVEEEYPLGNEIYRDTTGSYFTFPDLDLPDDLAQEIRRCVEEKVEPELTPHIAVTPGDGATAQEQLKGILGKARGEAKQELAYPFDARNLNPIWQQKWDEAQSEPGQWEKCPLCRLRPKRERDEVCECCAGRRKSRLQTWLNTPQQTIWLGEIADHNDRVALLVGKFGLEGWLSGDLVQTMLVKAAENNPGGCVPKNPSPARLRRVWETCQSFWQKTILEEIIAQTLGEQERKLIVPDKTNWRDGLYNGKVNGKPLDLYWLPDKKAFLTVSNLQAAGELKPGDIVTLKDPDRNTDAGAFEVQEVKNVVSDSFAKYQPWLSLLASPDQFLVFLPAARALDVARQIKSEYEKQFGKVRNRLPLVLGVVYFERKMPLMAVMDAARHMLEQPLNSEQWAVSSMSAESKTVGGQTVETAKWLTLKKDDAELKVRVPTVMGDEQTPDVWYPYWRVEGKPSGRTRWFIGPDGEHWVHVNDLKQGDTVHLTPSTFDFLWLDAAARRFEVHYDEKGRRTARPTRPYYLEDLDRHEEVWGAFSKLSRTQLKQILQTIETVRERWFGISGLEESAKDETFRQLVEDTLANAGLVSLRAQRSSPQPAAEIASPKLRSGHAAAGLDTGEKDAQPTRPAARNDMQAKLITAAVRGELTDWAELHLEILKEKNEEGANA